MEFTELLKVSSAFAGIVAVLGWWLKGRLEASIKHEYDRLLANLVAENKRQEVLHAERLAAFKVVSGALVRLRRYAEARSAELEPHSEFAPTTETLGPDENISLLQHGEKLRRTLDEYELFLSPTARAKFEELFAVLGTGYNIELWMAGGTPGHEISAASLYDLICFEAAGAQQALYGDLGFKDPSTAANNSSKPAPLRGAA